MIKTFLLLILFSIISCSKPKVVLICGDHICVNKDEAEQYFEENLSLEVKILKNEKKDQINLVELNLKNEDTSKKEVILINKKKPNKKKHNVVDVCSIVEKCNIEEISKYLIKQGKKKKFPDITIRQ